jgi:hypothetical protein
MNRPELLAKQIAHALEKDPIAARLLKEYIPPSRLFKLLELDKNRIMVYRPDTPHHHVPSTLDAIGG